MNNKYSWSQWSVEIDVPDQGEAWEVPYLICAICQHQQL